MATAKKVAKFLTTLACRNSPDIPFLVPIVSNPVYHIVLSSLFVVYRSLTSVNQEKRGVQDRNAAFVSFYIP